MVGGRGLEPGCLCHLQHSSWVCVTLGRAGPAECVSPPAQEGADPWPLLGSQGSCETLEAGLAPLKRPTNLRVTFQLVVSIPLWV